MGALVVFIVGSVAGRRAPRRLDQLIAARLVQAVGGGVLVPVGTAAASHLYGGAAPARARSGVIGALTFLGMAAGPFVGAAILASVHPEAALEAAGWTARSLRPRARLALGLLPQRPDRHRRAGPRLGGFGRLGDAAPAWAHRHRGAALYGVALVAVLDRTDADRHDVDRRHWPSTRRS